LALASALARVLALGALAACPGPRTPQVPHVAEQTSEPGSYGTLAGLAGDPQLQFSAQTGPAPAAPAPAAPAPAVPATAAPATAAPATAAASGAASPPPRTRLEARGMERSQTRWFVDLDGTGGPIVRTGKLLVATLGGTGRIAGLALRGEPGSAVVALDAATGAIAWKLAIDATDWSVITSIAAIGDGASAGASAGPGPGVVLGGSFSGTLRIGAKIVSSGGKTDGFVARLTATGGVAWLIRVGGPGADAVQGVAVAPAPVGSPRGERIAIAGTFAPGADLLGQPLASAEDRSPAGDGFVAELDPNGARRWAQTFGGKEDESVAGVAIDARGRIAVAATVRDTIHVNGVDLTANGPADGLVAWWGPGGAPGPAVLLGGADFDGLRAITAVGDYLVVAGFYSGTIQLGARSLTAGGGDDAFIAALDSTGAVHAVWPIGGEGREEVTALASVPGGFIAGIAHTAALQLDGQTMFDPRPPAIGGAVIIRAVR
jgi:hypothetical protein